MASSKKQSLPRKLDVRPDTLDFRDLMFTPTLIEVPVKVPLDDYLAFKVPVLDQGTEGACTGYGLASVANYLLRSRRSGPADDCISPHMFYALARRYDEWPGENYEGSSARGAMKGWQKHGACSDELWPKDGHLAQPQQWSARWADALTRPLGAYLRVNHRDLVAMHSAIAEAGILYATASVHTGWDAVERDGVIPWERKMTGGHAFAIVAYDDRGFWIQNSWGRSWGRRGFGLIQYDDWMKNGTDVWVARLGAPVQLHARSAARAGMEAAAGGSRAYVYDQLRPHIVSLGNDGRLRPGGEYGTDEQDVADIIDGAFPDITQQWSSRHLLLYAHGGLVNEKSAIQRIADYRAALLDAQVYPLAFIWKTDYWTTLTNVLEDALRRRRPEGLIDAAKDFMLDRLDDALEPLARTLTGKTAWDEMKENARRASEPAGGAAIVARRIREALASGAVGKPRPRIHLVAHSAGSILMAHLLDRLTLPQDGWPAPVTVDTCTLWAPACTLELFHEHYAKALAEERIRRMSLFVLTDRAERDDSCAGVYHKSLLYLVSNAFERRARIPLMTSDSSGEPLLGMHRTVERDARIRALMKQKRLDCVLSPNARPAGAADAAGATRHGDFDDDEATVRATLARVLGRAEVKQAIRFGRTAEGKRDRRETLMRETHS